MAGPVLVVNDVVLFTFEGLLYNQRTINSFYYKVTVVDEALDLEAAANLFSDPLADQALPPMMSVDWKFLRVTASIIFPLNHRSAAVVGSSVVRDGQVAGDSLPPSVTVVIARRTFDRGPAGRGRIFLPGVPEAWHDSGAITDAGAAIIQAKMDDLLLPLTEGGNTLIPVLWHRGLNTSTAVEIWTFDRVLRSQRRREIGIGI